MTDQELLEKQIIDKIEALSKEVNSNNVGDLLVKGYRISKQLQSEAAKQAGEFHLSHIRNVARIADIGWNCFDKPIKPSKELGKSESIQLLTLIGSLHELSYCFERLDYVSFLTGQDTSTPMRFYLNSIYHYLAAYFLLDKKGEPMGGTIYKVLSTMGLEDLLKPIDVVLKQAYSSGVTFEDVLRNIRNKFLVHGDFSPDGTQELVDRSNMHSLGQKLKLSEYLWDMFNEVVILKLRIIAILTFLGLDKEFVNVLPNRNNFDDYMEMLLRP